MTKLKAELPDDLYWLSEKIESMVRPGAFLKSDASQLAQRGGTRAWGMPDLPADALWARFPKNEKNWNSLPWTWNQSPYDGESFWMQLNLEEIPVEVRKPGWPTVGVVWVFIDLSDDWEATVQFDPRSAKDIPWQAPLDKEPPVATTWIVQDTLPCSTEYTMPEIWFSCPEMVDAFDEWTQRYYLQSQPSDIQVGGWTWPCQGDFDERNEEFVCGLFCQPFGDHGEVSLYYNPEKGFYAYVDTH